MIKLHPIADTMHHCPFDDSALQVNGWYIPGMRNLADMRCLRCGREYFGDLPAGHGLYYPMLLDKNTGEVHDSFNVAWFSNWLRDSYANRRSEPLGFSEESFLPLQRPLLLNCLDTLYGHCLLKLLNAQYFLDHRPDIDIVALVPKFLRWMVPDGVAAIWTVDLPLRRGIEWNDWLAADIHRRMEPFEECWLNVGFSHPHPKDFSIERFTRVQPFSMDEWCDRLGEPKVTFIWREDRLWSATAYSKLLRRIQSGTNRLMSKIGCSAYSAREQFRKVVMLAGKLRERFRNLDFAIAGFGKTGRPPDWILDLRVSETDPTMEHALCERYANSHVVIGVHGSHMLLPSAHAGAVVELMPNERWGNILQDILLRSDDQRETIFRYRVLPITTSVETLCDVVTSVLSDWTDMLLRMQREWCKHESVLDARAWRNGLTRL